MEDTKVVFVGGDGFEYIDVDKKKETEEREL